MLPELRIDWCDRIKRKITWEAALRPANKSNCDPVAVAICDTDCYRRGQHVKMHGYWKDIFLFAALCELRKELLAELLAIILKSHH